MASCAATPGASPGSCPFCLAPVFAEAQEQFHRLALRVVHVVHHAGHPPRDPHNRCHRHAPLFSPTASAVFFEHRRKAPGAESGECLTSCPARALGRAAREQAAAGRSHTLTVRDQRSVLARRGAHLRRPVRLSRVAWGLLMPRLSGGYAGATVAYLRWAASSARWLVTHSKAFRTDRAAPLTARRQQRDLWSHPQRRILS